MKKDIIVLTAICLLFIILRLPSLIEPNWYNDEGIYAAVASLMNRGEILYIGAWDHKPPGIFLIYSFIEIVANSLQISQLFLLKFINLIFGLGTVVATYLLAKNIFKNTSLALISTFFASVLLGIPHLEGNLFNAENVFIFFTVIAFYYIKSNKLRSYLLIGLLFGLAIFVKFQPVFELAAIIFIILVLKLQHLRKRKNFNFREIINSFRVPLFIGTVSAIPILLAAIYYLAIGSLDEFLFANIVYNLQYTRNDILQIAIPLSTKLIVTGTLALLITTLFIRKWIKQNTFIILIWFIAALMGAALSTRPYAHYFLQIVVPFSLLVSLFIKNLWQISRKRLYILKTGKTYLVSLSLILVSFSTIFVLFPLEIIEFGYIRPQETYYKKGYQALLTGEKSEWDNLFAWQIRELDAANTIVAKYGEDTWILDDSSWFISLIKLNLPSKYVVNFHIEEYNQEDVVNELKTKDIPVVAVGNGIVIQSELARFIEDNYTFIERIDKYSIYEKK